MLCAIRNKRRFNFWTFHEGISKKIIKCEKQKCEKQCNDFHLNFQSFSNSRDCLNYFLHFYCVFKWLTAERNIKLLLYIIQMFRWSSMEMKNFVERKFGFFSYNLRLTFAVGSVGGALSAMEWECSMNFFSFRELEENIIDDRTNKLLNYWLLMFF